MDRNTHTIRSDYDGYIARALAVGCSHLAIGRGGFTLRFGRGVSLSGYEIEPIKSAGIAAGLPGIHSNMVDFGIVARLAINGPLVAVGELPGSPSYGPFSYAPLAVVAESYRPAGAMVWNLARIRGPAGAGEEEA
jgi:hypothetical protein